MAYGHVCYFVRCVEPEHPMFGKIKIGKTNDMARRLNGYAAKEGKVDVLGIMIGYTDLEKALLKRFHHLRLQSPNSMSRRHGLTEWCEPAPELLDYIKTHARQYYTLTLAENVISQLEGVAKAGGTTLSELINEVLTLYVSTLEQSPAITLEQPKEAAA